VIKKCLANRETMSPIPAKINREDTKHVRVEVCNLKDVVLGANDDDWDQHRFQQITILDTTLSITND